MLCSPSIKPPIGLYQKAKTKASLVGGPGPDTKEKIIILYELLWHISRTHPMAPILNTPSMPSLTPSIDPYVQGRQFLRIWETTKNLYT
jgi:hypothetical protein